MNDPVAVVDNGFSNYDVVLRFAGESGDYAWCGNFNDEEDAESAADVLRRAVASLTEGVEDLIEKWEIRAGILAESSHYDTRSVSLAWSAAAEQLRSVLGIDR